MKISLLRIAVLVCLTSTVSSAQSMFRGAPAHTGASADPAPRALHRIKGKFPTGNRIVSSPVWSDGIVYFGGDDGDIYAMDAESGHQIWEHATKRPAPSTPAVADGALSYDGKLRAPDARNGSVRSKFATDGERQSRGIHDLEPKNQTIADPYDAFLSSPVVAQAAVYFGSGDGDIYAVDTTTGDLCWKFRTGDVIHASQPVADRVVYFGSWDGFSYAIDATTGKGKWRFDNAQSWIVASPAVNPRESFLRHFGFESWRPIVSISIGAIFSDPARRPWRRLFREHGRKSLCARITALR
ncbi:MAG TPA: PQQ-binding-like beta-propeller repeat protein [Chthoniobacterales bacterium]